MSGGNTILERREEVLRLASAHGARRVRLFGSEARGAAVGSSDIDLLVEMDPGRSLLDLMRLEGALEDLLGRPVDVVTVPSLSPHIRDRVLAEARPL